MTLQEHTLKHQKNIKPIQFLRSSKMSSFASVEIKILQWAEARKIIPNSTPEVQLLKAMSEMGELADGTIKNDREAIEDAVGDVMVCLINYCALQDLNLVDCMEVAYDQIKNRRGILLPNGVFQKEIT
jgi:NTP pyrophosphatase (non-canonical NTP hydrolase)